MNLHTDKPACYLESGEPPVRSPRFKDGGKWCYTTPKEARELTPGCWGCKRVQHGWEEIQAVTGDELRDTLMAYVGLQRGRQ